VGGWGVGAGARTQDKGTLMLKQKAKNIGTN
jgi:hypothetical protein